MSRVRVRVAAEVAFFTTFWVVEVRLLVFLPVTLSLTAVPMAVAAVAVTAVTTAFSTFEKMLFFLGSALAAFSGFAGTT